MQRRRPATAVFAAGTAAVAAVSWKAPQNDRRGRHTHPPPPLPIDVGAHTVGATGSVAAAAAAADWTENEEDTV